MNDAAAGSAMWGWGLALAMGVPLVLIALTEAASWLARRGSPIARFIRAVRNRVVPLVGLHLFLRVVLGWPDTDVWARLSLTVLWVVIVVTGLGAIDTIVFEQAGPGSWQKRVPHLLRDLVRLLLVGAAGALVYSLVWGRELSGALTALGVTSIVVGLALQEPLGNLFSGLMLLLERPFEVGDVVEVAGASGQVKEVNWRSAHIKSNRGVLQIVPNSTLNKEIINNYSRPRPVRMEEIDIGFCYDDPPNVVREALLEVASTTPGVLQDPQPIAATFAYGDSAINYKLVYRTTEDDRWPVRNEVVTRIWYVAKRRGLTIPYPVVTNVVHHAEGPYGKATATPSGLLERLPQLPPLPTGSDEVRAFSFGRDEVIFDDGATLNGVYLLVSGAVSMRLPVGSEFSEVVSVGPGEFFGEAGLYGQQPAEARAVASRDSEVLLLAPDIVRLLFESSPRLARETGQALEVRRKALHAARAAARAVRR